MRGNRRARELALQFLYMIDIRGEYVLPALDEFLSSAPTDAVAYTRFLVAGCVEKRGVLDARISEWSENWEIGRMATIDRNILRIGTYELLFAEEIPPKVSIDEAIEMAKTFGDAGSPAFVNGVLDGIYVNREGEREGAG